MNHARIFLNAFLLNLIVGCTSEMPKESSQNMEPVQQFELVKLTLEQAKRLASMPLKCMNQEFPNKLNQSLESAEDLGTPKELHPAFYGCYDWHSALHGHWMLVKLLKLFPEMENAEEIISRLENNISEANILKELEYFQRGAEKSFERTYGWSWLLKLAEELHTWENPAGKRMTNNLQPLTDFIIEKYLDFLPKLTYPIRVGEHTNTAFGLVFPYDYAVTVGNEALKNKIVERAKFYYLNDQNCPLTWEPSGFDFISPCLEEANLMRRILPKAEFQKWMDAYLPGITNPNFQLEPAQVSDRTDGKLVHLDGLNFSRAWCLYGLASEGDSFQHLKNIANQHIQFSLENVVGDAYEGGHWLASFAVYALDEGN
ncbi:MAG: DUF2891 domain-containing protein [Bacteroidetes bacterium]|nr:DUF2891 domain-containing protein [Bacteroidota bacterium]